MKKNKLTQIIILIVVIAQLFSVLSVLAHADSTLATKEESQPPIIDDTPRITVIDDNKTPITSTPSTDSTVKNKEHCFTLSTVAKKYNSDEKFSVCINASNIKNFHYVTSGISVNQISDCNFELTATNEFGSIDVFVTYLDGQTEKNSLYTYKSQEHVYVSDISQDQAWYDCYKEKYDNNQITLQEWQNEYSKLSVNFSKDDVASTEKIADQIGNNTRSNTTTINGRWRWELEDETRLPLAQAKVELWCTDNYVSDLIDTTYTDKNGYFNFSIDNFESFYPTDSSGANIFLRCYSSSYTFNVAQDWYILTNYVDTSIANNVPSGITVTFNRYILYDTSSNVNKRFYIHQGMVLAQRFASAMGFNNSNFISVAYPSVGTNLSNSAFSWGTLDNTSFCVIGLNEFNKFDTIIHEYAHFLQASTGNYGIKLLDIILDGPDHTTTDDKFQTKDDKDYAMQLNWSEAWATAFSEVAQEYFKESYPGIPGIADRLDSEKEPVTSINYNYESFTKNENSCEAQELAVIALLWDLFDNDTTESYDNINLGYEDWWNYTTETGTYTLTDFVSTLDNYYSSEKSSVSALMSAHQISAGDVNVANSSNISIINRPIISWTLNGSQHHPNNRFRVVFYNPAENLIVKSPIIESNLSYNDTLTFNVSQSLWEQSIQSKVSRFTVYVYIESWRNDITSGPYISEFVQIEIDLSTYVHMYPNTRYAEHSFNIPAGHLHEFTITTSELFRILIQTFGSTDTLMKLYDSSGNLILSNDDSGYGLNALITYTFQANTEYRLQIKFFSSTASGQTKLSMTPLAHIVNKYEDIYETSYAGGFTGTMNGNYAKCFVFKNATAITATISIDSEFDSFLYVLDPRSAEEATTNMSDDSVYNDDGAGNRQAAITKTFASNVPYFVIITAFMPSSSLTGYFATLFN